MKISRTRKDIDVVFISDLEQLGELPFELVELAVLVAARAARDELGGGDVLESDRARIFKGFLRQLLDVYGDGAWGIWKF